MNFVKLVGYIKFTDNDSIINIITKNDNDNYETIPCLVFKKLRGHYREGAVAGINGTLATKDDKIIVNAERITILDSERID